MNIKRCYLASALYFAFLLIFVRHLAPTSFGRPDDITLLANRRAVCALALYNTCHRLVVRHATEGGESTVAGSSSIERLEWLW